MSIDKLFWASFVLFGICAFATSLGIAPFIFCGLISAVIVIDFNCWRANYIGNIGLALDMFLDTLVILKYFGV